MPELPEVETVCRSLRPHLLGRTIKRIQVVEPRLRVPVDKRSLKSLVGRRIEAIERRAKYILFQMSANSVWLFHLGMSGKLICVEPNTARRKHDHIIVDLDDGGELRYHDPRRFGLSLVTRRETLHELAQLRR
ncbi:MAG: DNA-formamidopyrimidine glycosylase family protein, partial [Candidatus Binatia bacterium]